MIRQRDSSSGALRLDPSWAVQSWETCAAVERGEYRKADEGGSGTVMPVLRAVLDSNALDPFVDVPGAYEAAEKAIAEGRLELLITHVTVDEIAEVPGVDRRASLMLFAMALGKLVPTGAFVIGFSRLSFGRIGDDHEAFEALRAGNIEHTRDAMVAATAQYERCAVVTNDQRMAKRARRRGVDVLTSDQLFAAIGFVRPVSVADASTA